MRRKKKLSYEHVPPESTFINTPRKMYSAEESLIAQISGFKNGNTIKYKKFQRGFGKYTLWEDCNSFTGSKYGKYYSDFVNLLGNEVMKIPKTERNGYLNIEISKMQILAFFKQIISMFCSINTPELGKQFKRFLLDEKNTDFNLDGFRLTMYALTGDTTGVMPFIPLVGATSTPSIISTFPVGFVLYNNKSKDTVGLYGKDITHFSEFKYKELLNDTIQIQFLQTPLLPGVDPSQYT